MSAGVLGGLLGMGATIGGAIPNLIGARKQKEELERMQRGQGAGARMARTAASEAGRRVAGNVGGRGGSRNIRQGLRSAEAIGAKGSQAAGNIAARESAMATNALLQQHQRMADTAQQLGAGVGGQIGATQAALASAQDQGRMGPQGMTPQERQAALSRAAYDANAAQLGDAPMSRTMEGPMLTPEQEAIRDDLAAYQQQQAMIANLPDPRATQLQDPMAEQLALRGFSQQPQLDRQTAGLLREPGILSELTGANQLAATQMPQTQLQMPEDVRAAQQYVQSALAYQDAEERNRATLAPEEQVPLSVDEYLDTLGARTGSALEEELGALTERIRGSR